MAAYKKLSGPRQHERKYSRLWLADDHLLLATTTGYTEEYRRFYFSDIQAIFVRQTGEGAGQNWTLTAIAIVLLTLGIFVSGAMIICASLAGVCLMVAAFNAFFGPTCIVEIQTAVSTQRLPPLRQLRASNRIIAQLVLLIRAAQGETTPEQIVMITAPTAHPAEIR